MLQDLYDDGFGFSLLWGEIWVFFVSGRDDSDGVGFWNCELGVY